VAPTMLAISLLLTADPTPQQRELLKVFREEFIAITPGEGKFPASFTMGRESTAAGKRKPTRITFQYSFAIARYEVPQNLWEALMGANPSKWKGKRNSVEMFDYGEARQFCERATGLMREAGLIAADEEIRLPSESEWEYVARAGTDSIYSFGDDVAELPKFGWFNGNAAGNDPPVGAKQPNPWGLYDIHGYLREMCLDDWTEEPPPADGTPFVAQPPSRSKVSRSGSWKDPADKLSSFTRFKESETARDDALGLRCVLAKRGKE